MALNWKGLDRARFRLYRSWVNRQDPGICGTYCAAVLVHDRVKTDTGCSLDKEQLLEGLYPLVDGWRPYPGSFIWDIVLGTGYAMQKAPYRLRAGLFPEVGVPKILDRGLGPCIVGLVSPLGSKYGNHWVLAYQYARDEEGRVFFRCYDNHGKSDAVVSGVESLAYCYLLPNLDERNDA